MALNGYKMALVPQAEAMIGMNLQKGNGCPMTMKIEIR